MDWVAFAAAIGGTVVGVAGVLFGWLNARGERQRATELAEQQRQHERAMAREARLGEELRKSYEELLSLVFQIQMIMERTHPDDGSGSAPPDVPEDDDLRRVSARASVIGSEQVITRLDQAMQNWSSFLAQARRLDELRAEGIAAAQEEQFREYFRSQRQLFRGNIRELERAMRSDVRA